MPGLALADARARVPHIEVLDMDHAADAAFLERLADFCDRYTPRVALDAPDGLTLDITGCAHLFGGEDELRGDLLARLEKGGIEARANIAGTPDAARALARYSGMAIAAPGGEADAVYPLPAAALAIEAESVKGLTRAGLKSIADVDNQPRQSLAARFGQELVTRLARTLGEKDARINARRPLPACSAEQRFADPIAFEKDILATLEHLAIETSRKLEMRGEGGRHFEASFFRADGEVTRLRIQTSQPVRAPHILIRLFRERLDSLADPLDPGFGFDLIRLDVAAAESFVPVQAGLDNTVVEDAEVSALVDRLANRFGASSVLRLVSHDTHIPERAATVVPALSLKEATPHWSEAAIEDGTPSRPLHMFEPPQPIETLAEVPDGPPLRFRWHRVQHDITRAEGPERIAAEWWREPGLTRDYYRIEDTHGRRYWVFREGLYGTESQAPRWFLHGIFA